METYIALLLLIVPGFIAENIFELLNHSKVSKTKLEEIIRALTYSVFILLGNYLVLQEYYIYYHKPILSSINDLLIKLTYIGFTIKYILLTLMLSIILALLWNWLFPNVIKIVNSIRKKQNKNEVNLSGTIFNRFFNDGQIHAIKIEKDGKSYAQGFIQGQNTSDNKLQEVYLTKSNIITDRPDLINQFNGVYVNFEKDILIKEYDLTLLNLELEKIKTP